MRKRLLVAAAALLTAGALSSRLEAAHIVDRIVARVNNEIVTQRQYDQQRAELRASLARDYSGAELEAKVREDSKNMLRDLIDQDLMVQKAKDLDINVDTDVIKELDEIRQQYKLNSLEDLQKEVEKQGSVWEDFKDQIRRKLLGREVIGREVGSRIIVTREDARKYFQTHSQEFASPPGVHLAEILIAADKHKPEELEPRAKDALAEIKAGQKWDGVVKKYSDDPETSKQGGDVGFFKQGTLAPAIEQAISKLDTGETSDLIQTKFGYQIFKVLDRRSAGIPKFEEVAERVIYFIQDQKMQPAFRQYMVTLRKESYIYLAPGYVDTGAELSTETELAQKGQ
jgi:peptidyl-prolyl cis-trans isomerase SurA